MTGNTNFNLTQPINSFLNPIGLTLSNKKQIIAKITTVALAAILLTGSLPSVSSGPICHIADCLNACPESRPEYLRCAQDCFGKCPR